MLPEGFPFHQFKFKPPMKAIDRNTAVSQQYLEKSSKKSLKKANKKSENKK